MRPRPPLFIKSAERYPGCITYGTKPSPRLLVSRKISQQSASNLLRHPREFQKLSIKPTKQHTTFLTYTKIEDDSNSLA